MTNEELKQAYINLGKAEKVNQMLNAPTKSDVRDAVVILYGYIKKLDCKNEIPMQMSIDASVLFDTILKSL